MKAGVFPIFALAFFLSGCFQGAQGGEESPARPSASLSATATSSPSTSLPTTSSTPILNNSVAFSQCSIIQFAWLIPPAANPGSRPPEWDSADETTLFAGISLNSIECQRIAIGPFERGPVRMIVESHSSATFPPECDREATELDTKGLVASFWVDDEDIAQYLNTTYGIPVIFAAIEVSAEQFADVFQSTWSWAQTGKESSAFTVRAPGSLLPTDGGIMAFWPVDSGIVRLFARFESEGLSGVAHGQFADPMLTSQVAGGVYAGETTWSLMGDGVGEFTVYKDRFCEEPEAPVG